MGLEKAQKRLEKAQQKEARPKLHRVTLSAEEYSMMQELRESQVQ